MLINIVNYNPEPGWFCKLSVGDYIYVIEHNQYCEIISYKANPYTNMVYFSIKHMSQNENWGLNFNGCYQNRPYVYPVNTKEFFFISKKTKIKNEY